MRSSDAMQLIREIETGYPVNDWRLDGVRIWPLIRVRLYTDIVAHGFGDERPSSRTVRGLRLARRFLRAVTRVARAYLADYRANSRPGGPVEAVFFSDGVSFTRVGDYWYDRLFDPIIDWLDNMGLSYFMMTPLTEARYPRKSRSMLVQPVIDVIKLTASWRARPDPAASCEGLDEMLNWLHRRTPGAAAVDMHKIVTTWMRVRELSRYFQRVLDRTRPKRAFVNTYYSAEGMAFVLACRARGVVVADVQHGVQGEHHVAYGNWSAAPAQGYELLPHEFWVWSEHERSAIESWRSTVNGEHCARVVGNLWLDIWRDATLPSVAGVLEEAGRLRRDEATVHVLVTLQWGLPDEETDKILSAIKLAPASVRWWLRLHPLVSDQRRDVKARVAGQSLHNVEIDRPTDLPLYALLRYADLHVTHSSSVVIEAEQFGVPSLLTSDYGVQFFPAQIQSGMAEVGTTAAQIAGAVRRHRRGAGVAHEPVTRDMAFLERAFQ